jgi:hypothetical protein
MQPYVQWTLATRANPKLAFRYFGPFQVLACVGGTSYKLQLPESWKIHPVIHVSQLRRAVPPSAEVLQDLPPDSALPPVPVKTLCTRLYQRGGETRTQVLVQLTDQPPSLATWEDQGELLHRFPDAPAWGQAGSQPEGYVTTSPATPSTSTAEEQATTNQLPPRRGDRTRRPNSCYM